MNRRVQLFIVNGGELVNITYHSAAALGWGYKDGYNGGISVSGCGMDMLFHTIDCLSYAMGYGAISQNQSMDPVEKSRGGVKYMAVGLKYKAI